MFTGLATALITPFDENYDVDIPSLKKIVDYQISKGVETLVVLGTTGEAPVINFTEREQIISTVIEEAAGRAKIIIGTGTNDTKHVVEMNKQAESLKADGLLIVNPYYNKGTQDSIVEHYRYISERTTLPIILYNVPSRTGMNILPETAVYIHEELPSIAGIKEASGNLSQFVKLFSIKPQSFSVFSGNDDQTLAIMALGGIGEISVFSNAFPELKRELVNSIQKNNFKYAAKLSNKFFPMVNLLFSETSPAPIKFILSELGFCRNILRLPLSRITTKTEILLRRELHKTYRELKSRKRIDFNKAEEREKYAYNI